MTKNGNYYDVDYTKIDEANELKNQQEELEETESDTNESVPNDCMFLQRVTSNEKKPTKKQPKPSKSGKFDICGYHGVKHENCSCYNCTNYIKYNKEIPIFDEEWLATKLDVHMSRRYYAKAKGAIWSNISKTFYVRASNPHYEELCAIY